MIGADRGPKTDDRRLGTCLVDSIALIAYPSRMMQRIEIKAEWDPEASVWVATSEDLPGLVTEAVTLEDLSRKLLVMVPELLEADGEAESDLRSVPISLIAHREMISIRD